MRACEASVGGPLCGASVVRSRVPAVLLSLSSGKHRLYLKGLHEDQLSAVLVQRSDL